jgi:hypothetical protein
MTWLTTTIDTTHLDQDTDLVVLARPAIKNMADSVNTIKDAFSINVISNDQSLRYNSSTDTIEPYTTTAVVNAFTKQQYIAQGTLTPGSSISWNLEDNQNAQVTLNQNATLSNPSNQQAGAVYVLIVKQDSNGSRTLSYGSAYKFANGITPVLTTAPNSIDMLVFYSDGTNMLGTVQRGFA